MMHDGDCICHLRALEGSKYRVLTCAWGHSGKWLLTGGGDYTVSASSTHSGEIEIVVMLVRICVCKTISATDRHPLLTATHNHGTPIISTTNQIHAWDVWRGVKEFNLPGHKSWVNSVSISPSASMMASIAADREMIMWKLQKKEVRDG